MTFIDVNPPNFARPPVQRAHEFPSRHSLGRCKTRGFCTALWDPYRQAHSQLIGAEELSATLHKNTGAKLPGAREISSFAPAQRKLSRNIRASAPGPAA